MKSDYPKQIFHVLSVLLLIAPGPLSAQERRGAKEGPDSRQVFTELVKPYRDLNDYTVRIHAKVNMPAIRIPDFSAILYFKKPDKFHIETKSFAPIPRDSGVFNPFQFDPEKNLITYQRTETLNGTLSEVFKVEPLETKALVRYYHVWVGGNPRSRSCRWKASPSKGQKDRSSRLTELSRRVLRNGFCRKRSISISPFPKGCITPTPHRLPQETIPFPRACADSTTYPAKGTSLFLTANGGSIPASTTACFKKTTNSATPFTIHIVNDFRNPFLTRPRTSAISYPNFL